MADSRYPSSVRQAPGRDGRALPGRGRARERAPGVAQPGAPSEGPPRQDPVGLDRVVELRDYRGRDHRGRRVERRDPRRRSREEREEDVLELLGTYRVISRRALVEFAFDGHPFAASRTLASLERRGFAEASTIARGRRGYQVFSLTGGGRDLIAERRRKRRRDARREEQRFWSGFGDTRQLAHDHRVFEAVMQDTEQLRAEGGRIRRVRLESELRGVLSAAGETARVVSGPDAARVARCAAARRIGLAVFERDVPLPDALIEIEDAHGRVLVRGIEVALAQRKRLAYVAGRVRRMETVLCLAFDPGLSRQVHENAGGLWWLENVRHWLVQRMRTEHLTVVVREAVDEALAQSKSRAETLISLINDHTPLVPMEGNDVGAVLFRLLNQGQGVWEPMGDLTTYALPWRLAGETVAFERSSMTIGDSLVGLYSLALPPRASGANALGELYALPYDLSVVIEWRPLDRYDAAARVRSVQKHYNNARWSLWAGVQQTEGTGMALEDASSSAAVEQLHRAQLEIDHEGIPYGEFALSVSVGAESRSQLDEIGAAIQRVFLHLDGKAVHERYGQPSVWFQRFPGQPLVALVRPVLVSSGQAASLAPIFGPSPGYTRCQHLDAPPLTWFETAWRSSYGFDLFGGRDVGHTLLLGSTGSGKSFTLNFLLTQASCIPSFCSIRSRRKPPDTPAVP